MINRQTRVGAVRASFAATASAIIVVAADAMIHGGGIGAAAFMSALGWGLAFPLACIGCWLVGLPLHLTLARLGWRSALAYLATGIVASGFLMWLVSAPPGSASDFGQPFHHLKTLILTSIAVAGPVAALTFWSVVRPDKLAPPPARNAADI